MNKKVTQNVTNSNSEDLTDKWKKGELPSGYYYVKNEFGSIFPSDYSEDYDYIGDTVVKDFFTEVSEIKEVLEPVPSYEEYLSLTYAKEEDERIIAEYEAENDKLKKLLKECREILYAEEMIGGNPRYIDEVMALIKRINKVLGEE